MREVAEEVDAGMDDEEPEEAERIGWRRRRKASMLQRATAQAGGPSARPPRD